VNCNHHGHDHSHDDGDCGCGCGDSCGSSCGSGCGGCCGGAPTPMYEGPNAGKVVKVHYKGTFNDGEQFDSSYDRGEPMEFMCGAGMMIPGFDKAVATMEVGQVIDIHLMPEEAYGPVNPMNILTINVNELPGAENLTVGEAVYLSDAAGRPIPAMVTALEGEMITFDANSPMAGKELNFQSELVEVQ
ncbi:MAG: FKBP-type peptidyl-prolyl cis-trans isomerase, partial [Clostridiales bacterium]|nr:FKBP-type peptidyl-prolyl cis-trans isomerase [Candidatus Crickella merdequi]